MLEKLTKFVQHSSLRSYASTMTAVKPKPKRKSHPQEKNLITCKRKEFNLLVPEKPASKFGSIPLASKGWLHHKSKNDYFTINPTLDEHEQQTQMLELMDVFQAADVQVLPTLKENLENELDITQFTQIQSDALKKMYNNHHVLIAAETGCGKTIAYLLPIVLKLLERKQKENPTATPVGERKLNTPTALILTPGRELASQIGEVATLLCKNTDLKVKTILGGNTKQLMVNPEFDDIDIVVASMGAISKLVTTGIYRMEQVRHVVLDEADTLLDDSFSDKLCHFLRRFPVRKYKLWASIYTYIVKLLLHLHK